MEPVLNSAYPLRSKLLVVDDNQDLLSTIGSALRRQTGWEVALLSDPLEASARIEQEHFDLFLFDIKMPELDGISLLERSRKAQPGVPTLLMTAYASVEQAAEMMWLGADYYLAKPFAPDRLREVLAKFLERPSTPAPEIQEGFPTRDPALLAILERVAAAADSEASILIQGESGTGKELLARHIHNLSRRRSGPFEVLNSAAMPESLVEAMLFGHEKGAFTGAVKAVPGKLELAHGGTLFLDEVADMSLPVQAKMLRILQDRKVQRLGGTQQATLDVRYLFATNRDLSALLNERSFREDLFYRISVVEVSIPPLRRRPADVQFLAQQFLHRYAAQSGKTPPSMTPEAWSLFLNARWPGNVRQLESVCWRAVLFTPEGAPVTAARAAEYFQTSISEVPFAAKTEGERGRVTRALDLCEGNVTKAAKFLGISRPTLYTRMKKFGLFVSEEEGAAPPEM